MSEPSIEKPSGVTSIVSWFRGLYINKNKPGWMATISKRRLVDYIFLGAFFLLILVAASNRMFFSPKGISAIFSARL